MIGSSSPIKSQKIMEDTKVKYQRYCQSHPSIPIYIQPWYLNAVIPPGAWDVVLSYKGEELVGALPFFHKQKYGFHYVTMPPFVKFMGPHIAPDWKALKFEHAILSDLIEQLPPMAGWKQNFHYDISNWLPFYWQGYSQMTRYTYTIELDNLDDVYNGINRNMRRNIKKAKESLSVKEGLSPEAFYRINQLSFDRQEVSMPYGLATFLKHDAALAENQARTIFYAVDEQNKIHSAAYLIWDQQSSYYHLSGDDPALRQSGAGILLIWEAIRYTKEVLGLNRFDFEGSMIPQIEKIRLQFGAKQQPYFYIWKYNSKSYYWLDTFQEWRKKPK